MTFMPLFWQITKLSLSFVTFRVSRFPVSHLTHETVKLGLQNTLNISKTTRVYFGVLQYTFEVVKTKEMFDSLVKEKFITFLKDHWIPIKDELRGKAYCKYQNSWNHAINECWGFRNLIQDKINKEILKFPDKKETMAIDEDPFPPVALVNTISFDLRALI